MKILRAAFLLVGVTLCCTLPAAPGLASLDDDVATMQNLEDASRQKSLALLAVLKSMRPEFEEGTTTVPMARIVSVSSEIREARGLDSRVILNPNLNDEFEILDEDDSLVRLDLRDGRTGWINESNLQRFEREATRDQLEFLGAEKDQLRRYAVVIEELLAGIVEDREQADAVLARHVTENADGSVEAADTPGVRTIRGAHATIAEYERYARYFHAKYIESYDFSLQNRKRLLDNLSAWGELLLGKSSFTTTALVFGEEEEDEIDGSLREISVGGDLEINDRSQARASFSNKKEVNQTAYSTNAAAAGYTLQWSETAQLDFHADTYGFADEQNEFNDFRRTTFGAGSIFERDRANYRLAYTNSSQSFEQNDLDDYTSHGLDATARWKRGRTGTLKGRLLARTESSDVAFHDFTHLTPSLEYTRRTGAGQKRYRALYEKLDYADAGLRSFGRAQLTYEKTYRDGPRRNTTRYALAHKDFPDNEMATYVQVKADWRRTRQGPETSRRSLDTYTNFYPENSDNNYSDVRLGLGGSSETGYRELTAYSRIWHKPGDTDSLSTAKPYVVDVYAKFGWKRGNLRFGPTLGAHLILTKGADELIERDGNLARVGFLAEGTFALPRRASLTLNASYDYGFVYSDEFTIDGMGMITPGETVQRHPTTFQLNAFASMPLRGNFDLKGRLTVYRIATDMDETVSINPVTDNERFTLFAGVSYRHN